VPFVDYLATYRDRKGKPLAESTQRTYVRNVLASMRGARTTDPDRMLTWFGDVRINPRTSHGTANPMLSAVCHYFEQHTGAPVERNARPYIGALPKGMRDALSEKELRTFQRTVRESTEAEIPEEQGVAILLLLPATGLRISEACNLRRCDVNRKHGVLGLDVLGKGSKVRRVPLNAFDDEAKKVLIEYDSTVGKGKAIETPLFPSPRDPARFISVSAVEGYLQRLRETHWSDDDGQLATVECHTLRHTCATRLLRAKVPIHIVQKILGHKSIVTTQRYTHPTDADVADALKGSA
jgi:integrase